MTSTYYDVVVLGAGSGGYSAALRSAQLGLKVALIEGENVGGTCLHRGCIPTKAMLHVAETVEEIKESAKIGVSAALTGIDMNQVASYRQGVINKLTRGLEGLIKGRKIDLLRGWGRLVDANTIEVNGQLVSGKNIVLATGSYSKTLPGLEIGGRVITSDEALKLDFVPQRAIVLGGGVIGVEFASLWTSLGCQVTIIEGLPHLVNNEDDSVKKGLEKAFRARGIAYSTGVFFDSVQQTPTGVIAKTADGKTYEADLMLVAVGRGPRTAGFGFEEAGVKLDRGFVVVDDNLQTTLPGVYAVGDIVPGLQLAHRGFLQGHIVADLLAGHEPARMEELNIPRVTYCEPQICSVGLTTAQAEEKYGKDQIKTFEYNLAGNGKSQILGTSGFIKLVALKEGPIVGFHGLGGRIGELVGEGELIVNWEATPDDLADLIHAHPTQNEAIGEAAMALAGRPMHC